MTTELRCNPFLLESHQIDIVELTAIAVTIDDKEFKYVLSVLDVFSRFLWLRALSDKSSNTVAMELYHIYIEYGPPKIIQSDQGSEVKGSVKELCCMLNTKLIYSRSHHPQSQGKDERSHQTWKKKIHQDLVNTQKEGVCDWVTGLPALQRTYNEGVHRSLGISPYECFFGIKSNHLTNRLSGANDLNKDTFEMEECPAVITEDDRREAEVQRHLSILQELRSKAKNISDRKSEEMVRKKLSQKPPSKYVRGDKVLIKYTGKDSRVSRGGSSIKAPKVYEGIILESDFIKHQYRVEFKDEHGKKKTKWMSVSEITSKNHSEEKRKKHLATATQKQKNKKNISSNTRARTSFNRNIIEQLQTMILESIKKSNTDNARMKQLLQNAQQYGLELHSDNRGDGNCMFMALSHQLLTHGIDIEHTDIRLQLVDYLRSHPVLRSDEGDVNLSDFIYGYNGNLNDYLNSMEQSGNWGDNLILIAAANVFNARINVVSSLTNAANVVIEPTSRGAAFDIYLGHLHELHYVSLMQTEFDDSSPSSFLCNLCGLIYDNGQAHECMTIPVRNRPSSFPLSEIEVKEFRKSIDDMLSTIYASCSSNNNETQVKKQIISLAKDHNSLVFITFLESKGVVFEEDIIDGEYFLKLPSVFMDMYDEFRAKLSEICGTLSLIVLTKKVKQWLKNIDSFEDEMQQLWFPLMYLITQRAKDSLLGWLFESNDRGVEMEEKKENED